MNVLVVGVGPIGIEYSRILRAQGCTVTAIGRGAAGCQAFKEATGIPALAGGLEALAAHEALPDTAIVAVGEAQLGKATVALVRRGVRHILVEKPGGATAAEIRELAALAREYGAAVYVGYNRRFHASTLHAQKLIAEDGGVSSFTFEFTEWSHRIEPLEKEAGVKENWFLQNSSHVIDLAFHMCGWPVEMSAFSGGSLSWHPHAQYAGAGRSNTGAFFSYMADWQAPGRWWVEVLTRKRRFIFRPLEKLQVQMLGSVAVDPVEIDDSLDVEYKPGFYRQVEAFLKNPASLLTIDEQARHLDVYEKIHAGL